MNYYLLLGKMYRVKDPSAAIINLSNKYPGLSAKYLAYHRVGLQPEHLLEILLKLGPNKFIPRIFTTYGIEISNFTDRKDFSLFIPSLAFSHNLCSYLVLSIVTDSIRYYRITFNNDSQFMEVMETLNPATGSKVLKSIFFAMYQQSITSLLLFVGFGHINYDIIWKYDTFLRLLPLMQPRHICRCCQFIIDESDPVNAFVPTFIAEKILDVLLSTPITSRHIYQHMRESVRWIEAVYRNKRLLQHPNLNSLLLCEVRAFDGLYCRCFVYKAIGCFELDLPLFISNALVEGARLCFSKYGNKLFASGIVELLSITRDRRLEMAASFDDWMCGEFGAVLLYILSENSAEPLLKTTLQLLSSGKFSQCYEYADGYFDLFKAAASGEQLPVFEILECMPYYIRANREFCQQADFCDTLFACFQYKHAKTAIDAIYRALHEGETKVLQSIARQKIRDPNREIRLAAAYFLYDADLLEIFLAAYEHKQIRVAVLHAIWFSQEIRTSHVTILRTALYDNDYDVRKTALKASQLIMLYGTYAHCIDLLGLSFGCIFHQQFDEEMKVLCRCSSLRKDFDVFQLYLYPLLFSGNFAIRQRAWTFFDSDRLGLDTEFLNAIM